MLTVLRADTLYILVGEFQGSAIPRPLESQSLYVVGALLK